MPVILHPNQQAISHRFGRHVDRHPRNVTAEGSLHFVAPLCAHHVVDISEATHCISALL